MWAHPAHFSNYNLLLGEPPACQAIYQVLPSPAFSKAPAPHPCQVGEAVMPVVPVRKSVPMEGRAAVKATPASHLQD